MDAQTAQKLIDLNNGFYKSNAASFSATRSHAWDGWNHLLETLPRRPETVLDVACGNMRFKSFLDGAFGENAISYYGIDSCDALVPDELRDRFIHEDLLGSPHSELNYPDKCELVACFGFMHHIPRFEARACMIDSLIDKCEPGGTVAISFWQFAQDVKKFEKAVATTQKGCSALGIELDANDFLLGWSDVPDAYRYCHHFDDDEIDALIDWCASRARCASRYHADGKNGKSNAYIILRCDS